METKVRRKNLKMFKHHIKLTKDEFEQLIKGINQNKGNGYDYVPLVILSQEEV